MRVLVACEFSGIVRQAFCRRGHDAWSCDLLDTEIPGQHMKCNVLTVLDMNWDLMIAHPPCTYLSNSSAKHLYIDCKKTNGPDPIRWKHMAAAAEFFAKLLNYPIPRIAVENPIMLGHARKLIGASHDQLIQPWQYGEPETKATCLWLKNLPRLTPTKIVSGRDARVHREGPSPDRWKNRSRTLPGIAEAMAEQWSIF